MNKVIFVLYLITNIIIVSADNSFTFADMLEKVKNLGKMKTIAVAGGDNLTMLQACRKGKDLKITNCILVGITEKIKALAQKENIDISDFEIVEKKIDSEIALTTAELVRQGKADIYAKGSLETKYTLKAILDHKRGLKKNRVVTGITILEAPKYQKLLIFTDAHVRPYPTIIEKISLIDNAVEFAHSLGIELPKVAAVCALEKVNHKMRETEEALRLTKMNDIGQIRGCIVDGPLSFDLAINPKIPKYKGMENRKIKGDADIILFPNIHAANLAYNLMTQIIKAKSATLLSGTTAPCVLTSRASDVETKFNSFILAIFYSELLQDKKK